MTLVFDRRHQHSDQTYVSTETNPSMLYWGYQSFGMLGLDGKKRSISRTISNLFFVLYRLQYSHVQPAKKPSTQAQQQVQFS